MEFYRLHNVKIDNLSLQQIYYKLHKKNNMRNNIDEYLNPENLLKLKDCKIISAMVARGVISGKHKSLLSGLNIEFSEYREYSAGDSLRHIDWKAYAKKDKLYVKKYIEDSNLNAYIVLDISNSMRYSSNNISKYEYSIMLISALAYLLVMQQDLVGLILFNKDTQKIINLSNKKEQIFRILNELLITNPSEITNFSNLLESFQPLLKKRALFIVISDFLSNFESIINFTLSLKKSKNELYCFQILDKSEIEGVQEDAVYIDMETSEKLDIDYSHYIEDYKKIFKNYITELKSKFNKEKILYQLFRTDENFVFPLRKFLSKL